MTGSPPPARAPSVLVVLVVREAAEWLRACLSSLAAQTYPRLGVVAVDDASADGSREILVQALGEGRVLALPKPLGTAGATAAALALPVAAEADYVCFVRDDVELDPDSIARLVEAATSGVEGAGFVGVVGPKVVDHENPRLLRDVGRSADRFGHGYTALQPGEIDQGQYDRVIEVLCVSSSTMLVSQAAWRRVGSFDDRLHVQNAELDFCWRARLAGFRILMTPLARVRLHAATTSARDIRGHHSYRFEEDRSALRSMLKNYGLLSLLWLIPLSGALAIVRIAYLTLSRRFEEAYDVLAAGGWNVSHLFETLSMRRSVQRSRRVKDRELRRFMESAGLRLPRWFQTAERIFEEQREFDVDESDQPTARRLRDRTASLVSTHPVVVAAFLGACVGAVAARGIMGDAQLAGGVLPTFPSGPGGFFAELASGYRTTGLGGSLAASPALGAMGGLSAMLFGSTELAQKVMLVGGVGLAAVLMYRASVRLTRRPGASVTAAVAYALSAVVLWAFSDGRLDLIIGLAVLPPLVERFEVAFSAAGPVDGRRRFAVGLGVTIAIGIAFLPGVVLALGLLTAVHLAAGRSRRDGMGLVLPGALVAGLLLFTFIPSLVSGGGAALGSRIGTTDVWSVARLALAEAPGSWATAAFLPVAALLCFALAGAEYRGRALRAMLTVVIALPLTWLSAAGYLPAALSNAPVYISLAAVGEAMLVGFGLASVLTGLGRESFGMRQIGTGLVTIVLGAGIFLQCAVAMVGGWAVGGPEKIPAAWAVASSAEEGDFRVLWVGTPDGLAFPPPGGDPTGVAAAGEASLRYGLTGRGGITALDTGRTLSGSGAQALAEAMNEIVSGTTVHGGSLLAPFGIRFVVAQPSELTPAALTRLEAQVDLNREPESGLVIFRDSQAIPPASVLAADKEAQAILASGQPADTSMFVAPPATPLEQVEGGWSGQASGGTVFVSTEFSGAWRLEGSGSAPQRAFGWGTSFPLSGPLSGSGSNGFVRIRYGSQLQRTIETWLLALVWIAALWVTRKPVAR